MTIHVILITLWNILIENTKESRKSISIANHDQYSSYYTFCLRKNKRLGGAPRDDRLRMGCDLEAVTEIIPKSLGKPSVEKLYIRTNDIPSGSIAVQGQDKIIFCNAGNIAQSCRTAFIRKPLINIEANAKSECETSDLLIVRKSNPHRGVGPRRGVFRMSIEYYRIAMADSKRKRK